jgi:hypothetical protein
VDAERWLRYDLCVRLAWIPYISRGVRFRPSLVGWLGWCHSNQICANRLKFSRDAREAFLLSPTITITIMSDQQTTSTPPVDAPTVLEGLQDAVAAIGRAISSRPGLILPPLGQDAEYAAWAREFASSTVSVVSKSVWHDR